MKFSLIEPAGIRSEFVNRVMGDVKRKGGIPADDYAPVMQAYIEGSQRRGEFDQGSQNPAEVAEAIFKSISQGRTDLRTLTSETAKTLTAIKTGTDPSGNLMQATIRRDFLGA